MAKNLPQRSYPVDIGTDTSGPEANLIPLYLKRYDREHTRTSYEIDLRDFFGTEYVDLSLASQVTFVHVNDYLSSLEAQGYKASTLKRRVAALRGFFDWLMALGAIEHNPAHKQLIRRVRGVRQKDQSVVFLTSGQAGQLVTATEQAGKAGPRNKALILTLLHCVLRRSEAAAMDAEHIRPLGHYWILDLPYTKGGADQYVKMPAHVVEEIEQMKHHYGFTHGPLWRSLSNNNNGGRLTPQSIYDIVKRTAQDAGLSEQIGAHSLRHTGCTLALEAGATLQQVQTHARHKNIETTMVYLHQRDKLRDSAADFIHIDRRDT
ncbi:MAG TPA: tyrosine-type recombinase/integrase [Rhodothermales bacterium]|nr:tyrosine-type recombinase/integrase [Rhodothermales bacterium]